MNKAEINEHLKTLGAGAAVIVGLFLAMYFLPYMFILLVALTFFLGLAYVLGYMIRDTHKELKERGTRNRKSL